MEYSKVALFNPFEISTSVWYRLSWILKCWQPFRNLRVEVRIYVLEETQTEAAVLVLTPQPTLKFNERD